MKLLLTIILLAGSAFAQNYVKIHETPEALFYVDKASVAREGGFTKFRGKVEAKAFISLTDFATDCKSYIVLFEQFETADAFFTRKYRKFEPASIEKGSSVEAAINYVCYNTTKESKPRVAVPQTE